MATIVPAIVPISRDDLEKKLARLDGLVESVQIDVVDGRFARPVSWPYSTLRTTPEPLTEKGGMLPYGERFLFEADLMVADPASAVDAWIEAGATRLTLHAESTKDLGGLIRHLEEAHGHEKDFLPGLLSFGLAINLQTDLSLIEPYLEKANYVQFMGIATIGHQGEPFDERVLARIREFRRAHKRMPVQVDGGVSLATAPQLLSAGVTRLIVGSDLWKAPDLEAELKKLQELSEEHGIYE